jgi:hypothetical protein
MLLCAFLSTTCLAPLISSPCIAGRLVIDDFHYSNEGEARAAWKPGEAALPPEPIAVQGASGLRLPCRFRADTVRAVWDKPVRLDLSGISHFTFRFKVDDCSAIRQIGLYLKRGDGEVWNSDHWAIPTATEEWQKVVLPMNNFSRPGKNPGWDDIRVIRLSVYQAKPAETALSIADFCAEIAEGPENLLANSGFEICTTEKLPDFWGTGGWGLTAAKAIADTDAWRARWGVDETVSHSGKRSLRIAGSSDPASGLRAASSWLATDPGKPYTLSAWLRSDKANLPVTLDILNTRSQKLPVGAEWKRYSVTGSPRLAQLLCFIRPEAEGTLWIDDVQFERGDAPSEYRAMYLDATLTGRAVHRTVPAPPPFEIKPSPPSTTVKIDEHRRFLVNGEPFIPFAASWGASPPPEFLRNIAQAGFNSVCFMANVNQPAAEVRKYLGDAQANGLRVILWLRTKTADLRPLVAGLRDHPALIAWYVCDEPASITPEVKERYDTPKQLDPSRPVYINYVLYPSDKLGDIASLDDYPVPQSSPSVIAGDAETLERSASKAGKPSWIWLQDTGYGYHIYREPTGPEEECMTYLALIHGVKGIKYFMSKPHSRELWNELAQLAREVRTLTPILYSVEEAPPVTASPQTIHVTVKRHQDALYLIAVNARPDAVEGTLNISGNGSADVLFENRSVTCREGRITDHFEGFQRHVYRLPVSAGR